MTQLGRRRHRAQGRRHRGAPRHHQQRTHLCGQSDCPSARHPPSEATDAALAATEHGTSGSSSSSGCRSFKQERRIRVLFRSFPRCPPRGKYGLPRQVIAVLRTKSPRCVHTLQMQRPFFLACAVFCPCSGT